MSRVPKALNADKGKKKEKKISRCSVRVHLLLWTKLIHGDEGSKDANQMCKPMEK